MNQTPDDIKAKINKDQDNDKDDDDEEEDCNPSAQENKQANEAQDISDLDDDGPTKKKRKNESFSLGCKVLHQYIEFDDGVPAYIDKQKLQGEVQEAHQRLAELEALRREHQFTIDAYDNRIQDEHGLNRLYVYVSIGLGELQANVK